MAGHVQVLFNHDGKGKKDKYGNRKKREASSSLSSTNVCKVMVTVK